jgi:hypothetical protein
VESGDFDGEEESDEKGIDLAFSEDGENDVEIIPAPTYLRVEDIQTLASGSVSHVFSPVRDNSDSPVIPSWILKSLSTSCASKGATALPTECRWYVASSTTITG